MKLFNIKVIDLTIASILLIVFLLLDGILCLTKRITGLPCPTCGMTRAFTSLMNGDLNMAFFYHPLWPLVIIIAIVFLLYKLPKKPIINKKTFKIILILSIILLIAVYIYRMILYFPDTAPMDYNPNNLIKLTSHFLNFENLL